MFNIFNTYKELPKRFYTEGSLNDFTKIETILINKDLLSSFIKSEKCDEQELIDSLFRNEENSNISQVYSGHQFGHFSPRLGDGRALLLCEIKNLKNELYDIHLKGSGRTIYSRGGDGFSALGPVIREHILCEAMHALNVPTTRALASFKTNEKVAREELLDGGLFTRVAKSHIRFGTFEYFASQGDNDGLRALADYTIERHFKEISNSPTKYIDFIHSVLNKNASMIAKWMSLGFIHGVMNTDNMLICGETIDYGPCAFMDKYSKNKVFSSIDRNSRYAYSNQLNIGLWNIYRLASALLFLIDDNEDTAIEILKKELDNADKIYREKYTEEINKKLGLTKETDTVIIDLLLKEMELKKLDFTNTFKDLTYSHYSFESFEFYKEWIKKDPDFELMRNTNPYFIPRNHQVEKAIQDAYKGDFSYFKYLTEQLRNPYKSNPKLEAPPTRFEEVIQTFCGT